MAKFNAGDLVTMIKRNARMDLAVLGSNPTDQNNFIFYYMTLALWKYVGKIVYKRTSDPLAVTKNGSVTFQIDGSSVDDMYIPLYVLDEQGRKLERRKSFEDCSNGWFRESFNDPIDINGAGTYRLVYSAYHPKITSDKQELLWPQTSYEILIYETIGMIKQSKNDDMGASAAFAIASRESSTLIKTNVDSIGPTRGRTVNNW